MSTSHKFTLVLCAVVAATAAGATEMRTVPGFSMPESVLIDHGRRFVSNIGKVLDPTLKDGDGFISELDGQGRIVDLHAFPPEGERLDAPKGMAILDRTLYVADIDRVVGFSLDSRAKVFEARIDAGPPSLLNDLAAGPDGSLLVTDTLRGTLDLLDPATGAYKVVSSELPGANGVVYLPEANAAEVAALGADFKGGDLFRVDLASGRASRSPNAVHGVLDGIAALPGGGFLVSDWVAIDKPTPGRLVITDASGAPRSDLSLPRPVTGPADFAYDAVSGSVWLPALPEGAVLILPVSPSP